jgi:hypothetical protein
VAEDRQPERRGPPGHGSADRRRGLLPVAAAVGLLALVAVGSLRGPLGSGRGRPSYPADLVDSLLLLGFLAMVAGAGLAVVSLWPGRHLARQRRRPGGNWNLLLPMAAILILWLLREPLGLGGGDRDEPPPSTVPAPSTLEAPTPPADSGVVPYLVAGVALAAMVGLLAAQLIAERRRRHPPPTPAERLVELLDDTLEDLEADPDPRRAVIAAWARMERGLAAAGLPRRPAEAPFEYATRVLETSLGPIDRGTPSGFPGPLPIDRGTPSGFPGPLRPIRSRLPISSARAAGGRPVASRDGRSRWSRASRAQPASPRAARAAAGSRSRSTASDQRSRSAATGRSSVRSRVWACRALALDRASSRASRSSSAGGRGGAGRAARAASNGDAGGAG